LPTNHANHANNSNQESAARYGLTAATTELAV
jgi:hypothetical protein